ARVEPLQKMIAEWPDGKIKLLVTAASLRLRQSLSDIFLEGSYVPLYAQGPRAEQVVAFLRRLENRAVLAVAPRWPSGFPDGLLGDPAWQGTTIALPGDLAGHVWRNVFTDESVELKN